MKQIVAPLAASLLVIIAIFLAFENVEVFIGNLLKASASHASTYSLVSFSALAADIILPVPSSIVMYTNGWVLGFVPGAILSMASLMPGACIGYYLGKYTSYGIKSKPDARAQQVLEKYGALAILITRGIPVLSESLCIVCGYNKMPIRQYLLYNAVGYLPLCVLYAFFGNTGYSQNNFLLSFACSLLLTASIWVFGKSAFLKQESPQPKRS
jgi:uncharacterized membrane protein YdjX (TVP38/TMEM64 family)